MQFPFKPINNSEIKDKENQAGLVFMAKKLWPKFFLNTVMFNIDEQFSVPRPSKDLFMMSKSYISTYTLAIHSLPIMN